MSMRALESVLKLTADTTDFEEKLKKAGDATKVLEKNVSKAFNDPLLQAGMQVANYALQKMADSTERMNKNAAEWSPTYIKESALADVANMRADIAEGQAFGPTAAEAARIERIRAEQRMSNATNPTWASNPGGFWSDPSGWLGRKWDSFNMATDVTAQRFEQATGLPGILSAFTNEGWNSIGDLMNAVDTGGPTPDSAWNNPAKGMSGPFGLQGAGVSGAYWIMKWLSGGGG